MIKKLVFVCLLFLCFKGFSQNKEYPLHYISTADGLSQSSVIAIHQDTFNQMWFGTRDGLNKFDGNRFTVFRAVTNDSTSISNNDILAIEEDKNGFIWVGTYNGLNRYNPKKNTFQRYFHSNKDNSLANNTVWSITEMTNGKIWIGTSNGIAIFDEINNSFSNIHKQENEEHSLAGTKISAIFEASNGVIWIGTDTGLSRLINSSVEKHHFKNYTSFEGQPINVQDIIETPDKKLLFATKNCGLLTLNTSGELTPFLTNTTKITRDIRSLVLDNEGALWIGTYEGVYVLKNNTTTLLTSTKKDPKSLAKNSIKSIYKDTSGTIWIGTYYGGLNTWNTANGNFVNFSEASLPKGLSYDVVGAIERYNSQLFFATEGNGLTVVNTVDNSVAYINTTNSKGLLDDNLKSLLVDDTYLWVGTFNNGLAKYDILKEAFITDVITKRLDPFVKKTSIYSIQKDASNLYFGTFGSGVFVYNIISNEITHLKHDTTNQKTISSNLVRTVKVDSKNNLWIGTQKGLNKRTPNNEVTRYFYDNEAQYGDDISTIFEDVNRQIWIGTRSKGLFKLTDDTFVKVTLFEENESISSIHSIEQDDTGNLWISTNEGIIQYSAKKQQSVVYNQIDGLVGNEFNDNVSLKTSESKLYFGGPKGVTSFDTKLLQKNSFSPQVLITDFTIKGQDNTTKTDKTILFTTALNLNHNQGNFNIKFAIPNFINSENNSYKYRLKGLEKDWITTNSNTASYTIQKSGNYVFEVKGANNDGVWNTKPTVLNINVSPAPWRSWWAYLLYGILFFTALYFFVATEKAKTKLKLELQLEHQENEKIEETNKAKLEFFTNISHEFRTPLTLILGPLSQVLEEYKGPSSVYKKLLVIENSAKHLLHLINRLMDFRKLEKNLFKLEAAEGNIIKFLKEIFLSFSEFAKDGDYDYSFHTTDDEIFVFYDRYKLERVFYNLLSNAFRYTPEGGKISLRVKKENGFIMVAVEDSGIGLSEENQEKIFNRFFQVETTTVNKSYNKGTGIGLSIVKNVVKLHKGTIKVKNNTNDIGTIFKVSLPLGKEHLQEDEILKDFKFSDDVSQYITQTNSPEIVIEDELKDAVRDPEKPTILLTEDNKGLRKFMKSILKQEYNILEAANGKVAFKLAIQNQPNLIISDVVMPLMAGTELCAAIKSDIKTSHIPVILLTSRTSLVYKLDGLEKGANDYISKPFDVKEFKLRIHNILRATETLKHKFSGEESIVHNETIVSSLDEKLYKRALEIIEHNIANPDFDVHFFCSELGVSRTMLFVKIKAWTNFTPNSFILHFRMKKAAQLLEQGKINISEISYTVGFKNPKYFSKCFLKKYGETPSAYSDRFSQL